MTTNISNSTSGFRPRRGFDDSRVTVLDRHRTPTLDSATEDQRRFKVERFDAAVTPWPAWVLNSVDPFYLSTKIEKQLRDIQLIRGMATLSNSKANIL